MKKAQHYYNNILCIYHSFHKIFQLGGVYVCMTPDIKIGHSYKYKRVVMRIQFRERAVEDSRNLREDHPSTQKKVDDDIMVVK